MGLSSMVNGAGMPPIPGMVGGPGTTAGTVLGGTDMSILSSISLPDPEAQRKYEAMGLPDPVAFAALTALGAVPDPMAMLNAMMLSAQEKIDGEAAGEEKPALEGERGAPDRLVPQHREAASRAPELQGPHLGMPPGKSFVEAFKELMRVEEKQDAAPRERLAPTGPVSGYAAAAQRSFRQQEISEFDTAEADKERERKQREAIEQAKMAADRAKEAVQTATANRDASTMAPRAPVVLRDPTLALGVAQYFSAAGDDDDDAEASQLPPSRAAPSSQTLSSLLTGRPSVSEAPGPLAVAGLATGQGLEKICISRLPQGVTEAAVRLECARHGAVTSLILEADGSAAYVNFASPEMAATAVRRLAGKSGILGAVEPLQVRLIGDIPDSVRLAAALPAVPVEEPADPSELPEYLRPKEDRKKRKSHSRRRSRSRSRGGTKRRGHSRDKRRKAKKSRSRSMVRWLDRSRSNSHTATGQYIRATGCSSTVRWWEKKKQSSSSSSSSGGGSRKKRAVNNASLKRPRQVAVKGSWAQFVCGGTSYYYNVVTSETTWDRPGEFDAAPSRRPGEGHDVGGIPGARGATGTLL